ncbi:DNA methylase [Gordonia phage BobBob]|uniref:DNA methylase n=3 Tax=Vividuovirus TaxID=2560251 RepID=A0A3G3M8N2_9CAUD|nr:DNA methyltransferase [Gordonia phage Fosterous]YP_010104496.1 DNA methyltransferase [Gordonia phage Jabberwocky]YP_010104579.1 DNA methyltransferase [Gordonia phage Keitabear]QWT30213.1 DNA methylase [Gordonia phage Sedona]QXN73743.1 DNA methylase [Gordonia phage Fitzgerald]UVF60773.1 DNA methylase [Gordonia phage BobBob]AYR02806.1 DNA methylase [Gordonia phage Fosterous]QFP94139.1 DNA methylase [Gordonia phage Jabberwocky]
MKPQYADENSTLYCADMAAVLAGMRDESVDAVITDPPYTERTHTHAKTNRSISGQGVKAVQFDAFDETQLRAALAECGRVSRGWVVATLAYQHAHLLETDPPAGLRMLRIGVWVKTNPMPQISADRPGQGWEAIAYLHRTDRKPVWNGGGKAGNYVLPTEQRMGHPTAKPLVLVQDLVRKFSNRGDVVLDPFAGSGTTLRAAVNEGRRAIGVEMDPAHCDTIVRRLGQTVLF